MLQALSPKDVLVACHQLGDWVSRVLGTAMTPMSEGSASGTPVRRSPRVVAFGLALT